MQKIKTLLKYEMKYRLFTPCLGLFVLYGLAYFLFGFDNLTWQMQALVLERLLPLIFLWFMATFFQAEKSQALWHVVYTKPHGPWPILAIRYTIRLGLLALTTLLYLAYIENEMTLYSLIDLWRHTLVLALFLGHLALLSLVFFKNEVLAYLPPIGLILLQWYSGPDTLKGFYMFSWSSQRPHHDGWIFLASMVCLGLAGLLVKRKHV